MKEHRSENRILCADLVEVRWLDSSGEPHSEIANIEGISVNGASLTLDVGLPPGTAVQLRMPHGEFNATIRECRHEPDFGFALRAESMNKSRWSRLGFRPRHLFDPRGLERREAAKAERREAPPSTPHPHDEKRNGPVSWSFDLETGP